MGSATYRHRNGLFVSPTPGSGANHIYDENRPADGFQSDLWRTSLCGQSWAKVNNGKSLATNRDTVSCGNCRRILELRRGDNA